MEVIGVAALACGLISVGSCNDDVTTTILQTLMEKSDQDLKDPFAKYLPLGTTYFQKFILRIGKVTTYVFIIM